MSSIPREVEYTAEYEKKLCAEIDKAVSPYISDGPLSIIKEYVRGGPRLFHNNIIDPSGMFYITIEFHGAQVLCMDAKGQEVKTDGASLKDIEVLGLFLLERKIIDDDKVLIVEKRGDSK